MNAVVRNFVIVVAAATGIIVGTGIWHYQINGNGNNGNGTGGGGGGVVIGTFPCPVGGPVNGFVPTILDNYRKSKGLSNGTGFTFNSAGLKNIGQSRVTDMANNNYVGVINSQGQDIPTELAAKGVS